MKRFVITGTVLFLIVISAAFMASHFTLSALPEPGKAETFLATKAKHYFVWRGSRDGIPTRVAESASIKEGQKVFGTECAACHGLNGHTATDAGRWMYPRAADLASRDSQSYSDQELFWIIKNGIRLSGMPAFGMVEPDEHIWDLVAYVRILPNASPDEH